MAYDFSTLSPHDFELLTQDLLQRDLNVKLEGFKSGRDGGIDLRCSRGKASGLIVQCKHYAGSSFAKLKSTLLKTELPKIKKLAPNRYIVVTSRPLSVKEKDQLVSTLSPYCHDASDVYGAEDLNTLLRKHSDIEKAHFKLWIASTAVLEAILNNDLFARRYLETEEIKTKLSLFVTTGAVARAMEALQSHGFCLLSGIPGIGKTTTAEMLIALLIEDGWECICITSNAADAMRAYSQEKRQIFYYDDFLGQTSLVEKLGKNEDQEITNLIRACRKRHKTKRLILTTRNYILAQAKEQHEILSRVNINEGTCVVELSDYTPLIRARILVNHLWFYGVKESWCRKLVRSGAARKFVDHPNYSPRLIEALCTGRVPLGGTPASFTKASLAILEDPADLWRPAYESQLSDRARELLVCFASLGNGSYLDALHKAYTAFSSEDPTHLLSDARFHRALRELEGTFVRIDSDGQTRTVAFHNPSVKDFIDGVVATSSVCSKRLLETAVYYSQVEFAAWHSLGKQQDPQVEALVVDAIGNTLFSENVVPKQLFRDASDKQPLCPAQRLLSWGASYRKSLYKSLRIHLCTLAIRYLNSGEFRGDCAEDIANLGRLVTEDAAVLGVTESVDFNAVAGWLLSHLSSIDDHIATKWWVEDWDLMETDTIIEQVRKSFLALAESILEDLTDGEQSASTIEEGLYEVRSGAEEFEINVDEINFDDAEAALDAANEAEDHEADMREDERLLDLHGERESNKDIDDILDSISE